MADKAFRRSFVKIALPVTLQALLQASFGLIDQTMIGKLGKFAIAGIGFAGKFVSIYTVILAAVTAVAGIMLSQYIGKKESGSVSKSFFINLLLSLCIAVVFVVLCAALPYRIMSVYTNDELANAQASDYLRILSVAIVPMAIGQMYATLLRCNERTVLSLVAGIISLAANAVLNYLLIFGIWCFPQMGVKGAAWATVISQSVYCIIIVIGYAAVRKKLLVPLRLQIRTQIDSAFRKQYLIILCPMLVSELLWALGENVYSAIYGNIGTDAAAAMTMTVPVQTMLIGALSGLAQASGIMIGKYLGAEQYDEAYAKSKLFIVYALVGSLILSVALFATAPFYPKIYSVEPELQNITRNILFVFAIIYPVKTLNMVVGGGIIRSGGKTKYIMCVDIMGTWLIGVPLGAIAAFALKLDIVYVYAILSVEECARLALSLYMIKSKKWMANLK